MQKSSPPDNRFVRRQLPCLIVAGALVLYLATLCPWITLRGFATLARATGWDWHLSYLAALQVVMTFPVRWFPVAWQPFVANLIAAIFGSLTLGLLARSVALLPQDRTRDQRQYEHSEYSLLSIRAAWLPPLLAVLVLGLQITFWQNVVVNTGEALDLFLFAYVIRCL